MHASAALFVVLALAQVVLSFFGQMQFSPVDKCGPFRVNFTGGIPPAALPLSLTIVPFFSKPISIPIPLDSWNNETLTGAAIVDFLPLDAGMQFVATLDDANGMPASLVSDVIKVGNSSDSSCLPPKPRRGQKSSGSSGSNGFYNVKGSLNQCSQFNVTFKQSLISNPPRIRAFLPRSFSFAVNSTTDRHIFTSGGNSPSNVTASKKSVGGRKSNGEDDNDDDHNNDDNGRRKGGDDDDDKDGDDDSGFQQYVLDVQHGLQVVLLFTDGDGHEETGPLFTVGGDAGSSTSCFKVNTDTVTMAKMPLNDPGHISKMAKIIIGVVCGAVVGCIALLMLFIIRRKRLHIQSGQKATSFVFTEDISMGTNSFVGRALSRFWAPSPVASPRTVMGMTNEKRFKRFSDADEKAVLADARSLSSTSSITTMSRAKIDDFPLPPSAPVRPRRTSSLFSFGEVGRMIDTQFYNIRGPSDASLQSAQQPRLPRVVTPSRNRNIPDAPQPAVPRSPGLTISSQSSSNSPRSGTNRFVADIRGSNTTSSSSIRGSSLLTPSNFLVPARLSARSSGRMSDRT